MSINLGFIFEELSNSQLENERICFDGARAHRADVKPAIFFGPRLLTLIHTLADVAGFCQITWGRPAFCRLSTSIELTR